MHHCMPCLLVCGCIALGGMKDDFMHDRVVAVTY